MHTEGQIRQVIKPLVEQYGEINMSDVKRIISEYLNFDDEDRELSDTRNGEMKIIQRIGNISSHQKEPIKFYPEGFALDKTQQPAVFKSIVGLSQDIRIKSDIEIKKIKHNNQIIGRQKYKKLDWNYINERKTVLGRIGEEFVFNYEKERVKCIDERSIDRVIHLSIAQGDGFGYDISSINELGQTIFIEVKTTKNNLEAPFYMSLNEKSFFENNNSNAFIYRVYNFDEDTCHGDICIISAKDLLENYIFDPISFLVHKK